MSASSFTVGGINGYLLIQSRDNKNLPQCDAPDSRSPNLTGCATCAMIARNKKKPIC